MPNIQIMAPIYVAIIAGCVSILAAVIAAVVAYLVARRTTLVEDRSASLARKLLLSSRHGYRSFELLKRRLGGFTDDELRKILVRAGAIRAYKRLDEVYLREIKGSPLYEQIPKDKLAEAVEVWTLNIAALLSDDPLAHEHGIHGVMTET